MKVVGIRLIVAFADEHADARTALDAWLMEARAAIWSSPIDVKGRFASASFLSDNRVVFNIKGNNYRLLVQVSYKLGIVSVLRIGTHAEYSKWRL